MLEKLEECPACGGVESWAYDGQMCHACGYGDPANDSRHQQKSLCIGMETLRRLARGEAVVIDGVALIAADDFPVTLTQWRPIADAPRHSGVEIIGSRWYEGRCAREPFVSFWSPTLQKFYCDPTHFVLMPEPPAPSAPRCPTSPQRPAEKLVGGGRGRNATA